MFNPVTSYARSSVRRDLRLGGFRFGLLLSLSAMLGACNVCEDLDTRMCGDLGAEDCKVWMDSQLNFVAQSKSRPGRRKAMSALLFGDDAELCRGVSNDAVYPQTLAATKVAVQGLKAGAAAAAAAGAAE